MYKWYNTCNSIASGHWRRHWECISPWQFPLTISKLDPEIIAICWKIFQLEGDRSRMAMKLSSVTKVYLSSDVIAPLTSMCEHSHPIVLSLRPFTWHRQTWPASAPISTLCLQSASIKTTAELNCSVTPTESLSVHFQCSLHLRIHGQLFVAVYAFISRRFRY